MSAHAFPCPTCGCAEEPTCILSQDLFERTDSTSIGSALTEVSGDASISSNRLLMPSNGIVESTVSGPAASGANGHMAQWAFFFGTSVTSVLRFHVDVTAGGASHYLEVKPVLGSPNKISMELFSSSGGSVAGPELIEEIHGSLSNEQFICVSIRGTNLRGSVNGFSIQATVTPHGGTKTRFQTINTTNCRGDDYFFSKIDGAVCDPCFAADEGTCTACPNSDPPFTAPAELSVTLANLVDFYQEASPPCAPGVDGITYDCPLLDGTIILPLVGCTVLNSPADHFSCSEPDIACHSYANYTGNYSVGPGNIIAICEEPASGGDGMGVTVDVLLARKTDGSHKIWAIVSTDAGGGSEVSFWEADFDGDCTGLSTSPISMTKVCERANNPPELRACDHASLTLTVRRVE